MKQKKQKYPYPSRFGSHASMETETSKRLNGPGAILHDEYGEYETERWRLDNNLADPNRYDENRNRNTP